MKLLRTILGRLAYRGVLVSGEYCRWRLLAERSRHRTLTLGDRNTFAVRVRSGGSGSLCIGSRNVFGYRLAPRKGSGEILLQPRDVDSVIQIGDQNIWSNNVTIIANEKVVIANRCQIGDEVIIYDSDFHETAPDRRLQGYGQAKPVNIGENVWIGTRAMILKGVTIGDNSVIGAMSLVTSSIPANVVAVGIPARVIRSLEN